METLWSSKRPVTIFQPTSYKTEIFSCFFVFWFTYRDPFEFIQSLLEQFHSSFNTLFWNFGRDTDFDGRGLHSIL